MTTAFLLKLLIAVIGILGSFFISLFFYFLSSFNKKIGDLTDRLLSILSYLSKKIDDLKLRYFLDLAGLSKIFVFQLTFNKFLLQQLKKLLKLLLKIEKIRDN